MATTRHSATYYKYYNEDGTRKQSTSSASSASKTTTSTTANARAKTTTTTASSSNPRAQVTSTAAKTTSTAKTTAAKTTTTKTTSTGSNNTSGSFGFSSKTTQQQSTFKPSAYGTKSAAPAKTENKITLPSKQSSTATKAGTQAAKQSAVLPSLASLKDGFKPNGFAALTQGERDKREFADSSKRTFDQWEYTHKAQNSLEEWEQSSNELINRIRNLGSGYRGKTYEYTELRDTMKGLLYAAGDWKKQYADDAGVQNRIDTMLKVLTQENNRITDFENYYKQFTDAKDYERQVVEPMKQAGWQDKYNSLSWSDRERALTQLDPTGEEYAWLKQYNESGMGYSAKEARNGITALERQLAAKQAAYNATIEGTNYDGTNVGAYAQQIDDLKGRIAKLKSAEYFAMMQGEYGAVSESAEFYRYSSGDKRYAAKDDVYAAINGINTVKIDATDIEMQGRLSDYYNLMTEEEKGTYNTLYAVEGKKSADKYLEYISYDLNARKVDKQTQELMEFQQAHPWAAGILGTVQGAASRLFGGAEAYLGIAYQNARNAFGEYRPVDYNSATMDQFRVGNTLIQLNAQHIADNTGTLHFNNKEHPILYSFFEGKSLADLYQLGISMGESATVAALSPFTGGASVALLGMSAATQGVLDAVAKGASDEQALLMGTFNGAFEMLFEKISLEQLTDLFLNGTDNMIRSVVWQMLTEGTEEVNTTLANTIADAVIMGSKSDWQLAKAEYMANGQNEAAATISAMTDVLIGAAWDFVGGAVSGGVMGGFGGMVGNINYGSQYGGDAQQLVNEALELAPANSLAQKAKAKLDKGGNLSGGTIRRLVGFNENTIRSSDRQAISSAVENRLTELGETGDTKAIADAIAKAIDNEAKLNEKPANRNLLQTAAGAIGNVTGIEALNEYANTPKQTFADKHFNPDRMTADDRAIIDGSKYGGTVLQELQNGVVSWTSTLPVERIAPEKYARDLNEQQKTERKADIQKAAEQKKQPARKQTEKSFDEWDNERRAKGDEWNGETKPSRTPEAKTLLSKTAAVKTEEGEGTITGLVYDGGNVKANVKTESGVEAVELEDLKGVPQGIADAMEIMGNRFGEIAPAVWASYQEGQNMEDYINGASIIYELGKKSSKSWAEIKDSVMRLATTKVLNEAQAEVIFNEAKRVEVPEQQPRAVSKDAGKVSGRKVKFGNVTMQGADLRNLRNDTEKQVVSLARQIAKATDINITFYREGTLSHMGAQKANNIYLNLDNIKDGKAFVMQTMSHELTHFIKEYNPEVYNMLRDFVVDKLLIKESGRDLGQLINDKQAREKGLSYSRAIDEVVADGCEMMLQNSEAVQLLAQQDESLAQKIAKWVKSFVAKIKALFENLDPKHEEAAELMKYADELQQIWDYALADAVGKARAETVSAADNGNISGASNSFAGIKAKTANRMKLSTAEQMEENGVDSETIRKETGWFRGYDRQWRFEISDADMVVYPNGENPNNDNWRVRDFIDHPLLFKAYPMVAEYYLQKSKLPGTLKAYTSYENKLIGVNESITSEDEFREAVAHELQHVVQGIEGYAKGTNADSVKAKHPIEELFAPSTSDERKVEIVKSIVPKLSGTYAEYLTIENQVNAMFDAGINEENEKEFVRLSNKEEQLENELSKSGFGKYLAAGYYDENVWSTLYTETAGEVEARDTANRRSLTKNQRRETRPDIDRTDVVFAYSLADENMTIEDYKKALKESQDALKAAEKKNAELQKRYTELRRNVGMAMPEARADDVKKFTNRIVKKYSSKGSAAEVLPLMQRLGNYVARGNAKMETLIDRAGEIAEIIAENAVEVIDPGLDLRTALKKSLKAEKYYLDPKDRADLVEPYGDFSRKYRKYFTLSKDGGSIDAKWVELREQFGDLFPADISSPADKLTHIAQVMDSLQPEYINPLTADIVKATEAIRTDIIDALLGDEIREYDMPSVKIEHEFEMKAASLENTIKQLEQQKKQALKDTKQQIDEALKEQAQREKDRQQKEKLTKAVERKIKSIEKKLTTNSPKEHVPEMLKEPLAQLLLSLDTSSKSLIRKGRITEKDKAYISSMRQIAAVLNGAQLSKETNAEKVQDFYIDLPKGFVDDITSHIDRISNAWDTAERRGGITSPVYNMDVEELGNLDYYLGVINSAVISINELFANSRYTTVAEIANKTIHESRKLRNASGKLTGLDNFTYWQQALPYYAFKRYGEGGFSVFEGIMDGWDKFAKNSREVIDWSGEQWTDKEVKGWDKDKHQIELESGDTVTMTTAQMMLFYMHTHREQSRNHLFVGGMQIEGGNGTTYKMTINDAANITKQLTERQKSVADKMQHYMSTVGSDWGNEVSMRRFGYKAFNELDYVPIKVAEGNKSAKPASEERSLYTLLNKSFTKNIVENAGQPIVIGSAFDVFSDHMADMAKYNALGLPLLDALKWFNYSVTADLGNGQKDYISVHDSMQQAFGSNGVRYFLRFIEDLNGKRDGGRADGAIGALTSTFKAAAVGFNIRVAIQQPTAYVRAAAVIDPKYLAKAAVGKNNTKEMLDHSGIAIWKDLGFYDTNIGRNVRDQIKSGGNLADKAREFGMTLAEKGDQTTWGRIWKACKLEQQTKGFTGDALIEATEKRFREVIYATQVVDGTMTRSQLMRGTDAMSKAVTAFRSEPTLTYNLVANTVTNYYDALRRGESKSAIWKKQGKNIARVFGTYVMGSLATAAAAAIADAIRDDDEYEQYWEKWLEAMTGDGDFLSGNIFGELNPFDKLPIVSDIFAAVFQGNKSEQMFLQAFTEMRETYNAIVKYNSEGKGRTLYGVIYKGLQTISHLSGLGIGNGTRDAVGLYNTAITLYNDTIGRITGNKLEDMKVRTFDNGDESDIKEAVLGGHISEDEAEELLIKKVLVEAKGNRTAEDEAYWTVKDWLYKDIYGDDYNRWAEVLIAVDTGVGYDEAVKEMLDHGYNENEARSKIKAFAKESFFTRNVSVEETKKKLSEYCGLDKKTVDNVVREWQGEKEMGFALSSLKSELIDGNVSAKDAVTMLTKYGDKTETEATVQVEFWKLKDEHPEYTKIRELDDYKKWYYDVKPSGIDIDTYYDYYEKRLMCKGVDNDGDGKADTGTVKREALLVIDALPITYEQKDALYRLNGWSENKFDEAPWHNR